MKTLSATVAAATLLATCIPALAAQDAALIDQARSHEVAPQGGRVDAQDPGAESLRALDHGPRATTTPWVLAQRKQAAAGQADIAKKTESANRS